MSKIKTEDQTIVEILKAARLIQEFLWGDMNDACGLEEFKRMFRKRLAKIDQIDVSNPHWRTELKKRVLQTAAISVNLITKLDNGKVTFSGTHPFLPSNLPDYEKAEKKAPK
ncbi:MAG: hypothetical protein HOI42_13880 [Candidatus Marinimicrobia bacterium]|jgi:hypothetical protein|nr:hypothetical protein [Candidatus Neomarinimicrobiota bacterium]